MVDSFQRPVLTVSEPTLVFSDTSPGEQYFLILTISQKNAETPVSLEIDAPDLFQLATDKMPAFTNSVTFTPAPGGTYVHIRYTPHKAGQHQAKLTIQAPYDRQKVTLMGQSGRKIPAGLSMGLLALVIVGGLTYAGIAFRCEIAPSLCEEEPSHNVPVATEEAPPAQTQPDSKPEATPVVPVAPRETPEVSASKTIEESDRIRESAPPVTPSESKAPVLSEKEPEKIKRTPVVPPAAPTAVATAPARVPQQAVTKPTATRLTKVSKPTQTRPTPKPRPVPHSRAAETVESDLERELNRQFEK